MAINSQLVNLKNKPSKQAKQKQNHKYGDHLEGYHLGEGKRRMEEKMQGLRSTNWQVQNKQGWVLRTVQEMEKQRTYVHGPWT